ncbi:MAG: HAD hydrolase-like protein [Verrucomicrobiota bacterium]
MSSLILDRLPQAVVFDFDGVLAESNQVKNRAFEQLAAEYGVHAKKMLEYHRQHQHAPRIEKFYYYATELFGYELDSDLWRQSVDRLGEQFSSLVKSGVIAVPEVRGVRALLTFLKEAGVYRYIASTTPHDELQEIVAERDLGSFFDGIYGNPPHSKRHVIKRVIQERELKPDDLLFIGDSMADYDAASAEAVPFWGRISENHFTEPAACWFEDLEKIRVELVRIKDEH